MSYIKHAKVKPQINIGLLTTRYWYQDLRINGFHERKGESGQSESENVGDKLNHRPGGIERWRQRWRRCFTPTGAL